MKLALGHQETPKKGEGEGEEMGKDPNINAEYKDEHEMPMDIPGFNDAGREPDVQDYVRNGEIFE